MKLFEQPLDKICTKANFQQTNKKLGTNQQQQQNGDLNTTSSSSSSNSSLPKLPPAIERLLSELHARGPSTVGIFRKSPNAKQCKELRNKLETSNSSPAQVDAFPVTVVASVFKEWLRSLPDCLLMSRLYDQWIEVAKLIEPLQSNAIGACNLSLNQKLVDSCTDLRNVSLDSAQAHHQTNFFSNLLSKRQPQLDRARSCSTVQFIEEFDSPHLSSQNVTQVESLQVREQRKLECRKMVRKLIESLDEPNVALLRALICVLWHIAENSQFNKMSAQNLGVCVGQSLLNDNCKKTKRHRRTRSQCLLSLTLSWSSSNSNSSSKLAQLGSAQEIAKYVPLLVAFMIENAHELFGDDVTNLFSPPNNTNKLAQCTPSQQETQIAATDCNANSIQFKMQATDQPKSLIGSPTSPCRVSPLKELNLVQLAQRKQQQQLKQQQSMPAPVKVQMQIQMQQQPKLKPKAPHQLQIDGQRPPDSAAPTLVVADQLDGIPIISSDSLQIHSTPKLIPAARHTFYNECQTELVSNNKRRLAPQPPLQSHHQTELPQQQQVQPKQTQNDNDGQYKTTIMIVNKGGIINHSPHNNAGSGAESDANSQRAPSSVLGAHSPTLSNYTQSHNSSQAEISVATSSSASSPEGASSGDSSSSFSSLSPSSNSSPTPPAVASSLSLQSSQMLAQTPSLSVSPASSSPSPSETACSNEKAHSDTNEQHSLSSQNQDKNVNLVKIKSLDLSVNTTNAALDNQTMKVANCAQAQQYQRSPITRQEMLRRRHLMNRYSTILGIPNRSPKIPVRLTTSNYGGEAVIYNPSARTMNGFRDDTNVADELNSKKVITVDTYWQSQAPYFKDGIVVKQQLASSVSQPNSSFSMPFHQMSSQQTDSGRQHIAHFLNSTSQSKTNMRDFCQEPRLIVNTSSDSLSAAPSLPFLPIANGDYQCHQNKHNSSHLSGYCYEQQNLHQYHQNQINHHAKLPLSYTASNTNLNRALQHEMYMNHQMKPQQQQRSHVMLLRDHYLALHQQRQRQQQQFQHRPVNNSYSQNHHRPPVLYTLL